jgi:hypothetical protein
VQGSQSLFCIYREPQPDERIQAPSYSAQAKIIWNDKPLAEGEIRLLKLLPGSDREPIKCYLYNIRFHGSLEYEALSYACDDEELRY